MAPMLPYQLLADAVLLLHFGIVLFVIGGLMLVVAGNLLGRWPWVNGWWFRLAHLLAIGVIVAQAWLGQVCALTTLESWLRVQAGALPYRNSFIEHWVQRLLFYDAPFWVFALAYTVFGLLVLGAWWYFPPRYRKRAKERGAALHGRQVVKLLWAAPCSAVGLLLAVVPLALGGKAKWSAGALEVTYRETPAGCGKAASTLPFRGIVFGHVILAVTAEELRQIGPHERVHVEQYERWGPLFFIAYGASGLWQLLKGRSPYWYNHFEVQARRAGAASSTERQPP